MSNFLLFSGCQSHNLQTNLTYFQNCPIKFSGNYNMSETVQKNSTICCLRPQKNMHIGVSTGSNIKLI